MTEETPSKPTRDETSANLLRLGKCLNDLAFPERGLFGRPHRPHEIESLKAEIQRLETRIEEAVADPNQRLLRSALGVRGDGVADPLAIRILAYVAWAVTHLDRMGVSVSRVAIGVSQSMESHLAARRMVRQLIIGEIGLRYRESECGPSEALLPGLRLVKYMSGDGQLSVIWSPQVIEDEKEQWRRHQEDMARRSSSSPRVPDTPPSSQKPSETPNLLTAKGIFDALKDEVIGIDAPLRRFSAQMSLHMRRLEQIRKGVRPSVGPIVTLLIGSSGSGKTWMAENFARVSGLPYAISDMSAVSQSSYVGLSLDECFYGLLANKTKIAEAQKGIVVWDEFDKICAKGSGGHSSVDAQGLGIQAELLKPLDGCRLPLGSRRSNSPPMGVLDSYETCFVLAGAFDGLRDQIQEGSRKSMGLGFGSAGSRSPGNDIREALVRYGFMKQIINRIGAVIFLADLIPDQILRITTHPETGLLAKQNAFLGSFGLKLILTEEALRFISNWACETRGYSRSVKTLLGTLVEGHLIEDRKGSIEVSLADVKRAIEETEGAEGLQ